MKHQFALRLDRSLPKGIVAISPESVSDFAAILPDGTDILFGGVRDTLPEAAQRLASAHASPTTDGARRNGHGARYGKPSYYTNDAAHVRELLRGAACRSTLTAQEYDLLCAAFGCGAYVRPLNRTMLGDTFGIADSRLRETVQAALVKLGIPPHNITKPHAPTP